MYRTRRAVTGAALAIGALTVCAPGQAQDFPGRPVRFLLGSAAGSVPDVATRQIAERLSPLLGQAVVVENRPSAGGIAALQALKASAPDGYTLSLVHVGNMSVAPSLFEKLPYDTLKDFTHVGIFWRGVQVLVANPRLAATDLAGLIALAKTEPGRLRYSSPGNGTPTHLFMEQFNDAAGISIQHIPYKGPAAHVAVLNGEVDVLLEGVEPLLPHIRAGKLKVLAVGGSRRIEVLPGVPTFEELGIPNIGTVWLGVVAPSGTPAPIVARLNRDLAAAVRSPDIVQSFERAGRLITPGTPLEMADTIRDEIPHWREIIRRANIKPD